MTRLQIADLHLIHVKPVSEQMFICLPARLYGYAIRLKYNSNYLIFISTNVIIYFQRIIIKLIHRR